MGRSNVAKPFRISGAGPWEAQICPSSFAPPIGVRVERSKITLLLIHPNWPHSGSVFSSPIATTTAPIAWVIVYGPPGMPRSLPGSLPTSRGMRRARVYQRRTSRPLGSVVWVEVGAIA